MNYTTSFRELALGISLLICSSTIAQKDKMLKQIWYKDHAVENKNLRLNFLDGYATENLIKFKLKIVNLNSGFLLMKSDEVVLKINGASDHVKENWILIEAINDAKKVIDLKGKDFRCDKFTFDASNAFYFLPSTTVAIPGPDFTLTPNDKEISIGDIKITMVDLKKDASNTVVKFKVEYSGDRVAIVDPNKVMLMMADKKEYSQKPIKGASIVLKKGVKEIMIVRFSKDITGASGNMEMQELTLKWKNAFIEGEAIKIALEPFEIIKDNEMTYDKNH